MTKNNIKIIEVIWDGPLKIGDIESLNKSSDYGIYQIYGHHEVYGSDSLLYLGKAQERLFSTRLMEHRNNWFEWESSELNIYVGRLGGVEKTRKKNWSSDIAEAERLLIHYCTPAYNSSNIQNLNMEKDIVILNYGKKKSLPYSVTSLYHNSQFWEENSWKVYK
ncbi:hypothetical protein [Reichenbachiella versicolor]|uniref:hypothetical protein n=1 Tax=Reichenbachiella versicolor TaxID=1821036 RepID=UPI000D6E6ABF|nr:hypothetical protein [Reichenbachiella versicolor]